MCTNNRTQQGGGGGIYLTGDQISVMTYSSVPPDLQIIVKEHFNMKLRERNIFVDNYTE